MANFDTFDALLNETLGALEEKGAEEEKPKKKKKKNKNKGGENRPSSSSGKSAASSKKTEYNLDLPDLKLEPEEDCEIEPEESKTKEEETLPAPEVIEEPEITNPVTFEETHKKIGEEVTEEYVEKLMEEQGMPEEGHKATVIIHTRTITDDSAPEEPAEDFEVKAKEPDEEDAEAELLRQIKKSEESAPKVDPPAAKVTLVRKDTGEIFEIANKTTIGREEGSDIVIEDDIYLSENHATFKIDNKGKVLIKERDGGTTNGTYVNGNKVGSKYLKSGDTLKLGNLYYIINIE